MLRVDSYLEGAGIQYYGGGIEQNRASEDMVLEAIEGVELQGDGVTLLFQM